MSSTALQHDATTFFDNARRQLTALWSIAPQKRVTGEIRHALPEELAAIAQREESTEQELERALRVRLGRTFGAAAAHATTKENFTALAHELLFAEEAAERVGLRKNDVRDPVRRELREEVIAQHFPRERDLVFAVDVPNLDERRPSVQEEDRARIFLRYPGRRVATAAAAASARARPAYYDDFFDSDDDGDGTSYDSNASEVMADVAMVLKDEVVLRLSRPLPADAVIERIRFEPPNGTFPVLHEAVDAVGPLLFSGRLLLPVPSWQEWLAAPPLPADVASKLNREQREFAEHLLDRAGPRLAILEGPPGTGKSRVMCDIVTHLARSLRGKLTGTARAIVICAHTNSVCDYLVELLAERGLQRGELIRINSTGRAVGSVSGVVRQHSIVATKTFRGKSKEKFCEPNDAAVRSALVVVATFPAAGRVLGPSGLYASHLFVDEAGQATEADLCLALALLNNGTQRVVLAGDPRQLGPVVLSPCAREYGLGRSALERLMSDNDVRARCSVMLKECYRCHPAILNVFNLFYGGLLRSPADGGMWARALEPSSRRRVKVIDAHRGREAQSPHSPSFFNNAEIDIVVREVRWLIRNGVAAADIVIVAPYKEHAKKMRQQLHFRVERDADLTPPGGAAPDVGTVEVLQGREAKVVIVTLCRTTHEGFLRHAARANVAISRAIDQLIVVCNHALFVGAEGAWGTALQRAMRSGAQFIR